ncbi:Glutathione transport system permease protein GsiD [Candidatus Entotheonellaceae bacterium PAL068K]
MRHAVPSKVEAIPDRLSGISPQAPSDFAATLLRFARRKPLGTLGGCIVVGMLVLAIFAPWIAPYSPEEFIEGGSARLQPPSLRFLMGTDNLGRDILSRVIYGARLSMLVGFISTFFGTGIGALIALFTAYVGGKWDLLAQRCMDVLWAFPSLVIAIVIVAVIGRSTTNLIIAIAIVVIPSAARVVRSAVLVIKETEYVQAARAVGAHQGRIMFHYIAPNCMAPYLILATASLGNAIITEASLSFLGLGIPPPAPSWGRDLFGSAQKFAELAPWMPIMPGIAISLTVYGFNLFGDAIRDTLDPRLRVR